MAHKFTFPGRKIHSPEGQSELALQDGPARAMQTLPNSALAKQYPGHMEIGVLGSPLQRCPSVGQLAGTTCWQVPLVQKSKVEGCPSSQFICGPAHTEALQVSGPVHESPSSHVVPSARGVRTHDPAPSHVSVVQGLPLEHAAPWGAVGWTHAPAASHVSVVQGLPSSGQTAPCGTGVCWQPLDGWQVSTVQALPSSQDVGSSNRHFPVVRSQRLTVQGLSSSHMASLMHSTAQVHPPLKVPRSRRVVSP
jgi:hypothetical protein